MDARPASISDAFPLDPPKEWFTELPDWFQPSMKATVVTDGPEAGRFAGTVAQRGTYLLHPGVKWSPSDSPTNYREAMQGDTYCSDGSTVRTANLSSSMNHVPDARSFNAAVDAMSNTGTALARVRFVDLPGYGTVALGAAWPGLTDVQVRMMQASALSGDWRYRPEYQGYDMAGAIFVNTPGLPLPSRPVFAPVALAASLHSPIVGAWAPREDQPMSMTQPTMTNPYVCGSCGNPVALLAAAGAVRVAPCAVCVGAHTAAPTPALPPTPDAKAPAPAPSAPSVDDRISALEQRVDALEEWAVQDAMSDMDDPDAIGAALPDAVTAAEFTDAERKDLTDKGQAMSDGSFPIKTCADIPNAVTSMGRSNHPADEVKQHIIDVARKLDCMSSLPQNWQDELKTSA